MKKTLLGFSVAAVALLAIAPINAYAVPQDAPPPPLQGKDAVRPPFPPLSEEQMAQVQGFEKEYLEAVSPLREQLKEKKMELKALSPNPNTKPEELRQIIKDIIALEKQIDVQKDAFRDNMIKAGIPCPGPKDFPGPHHGLRGPKGPRHGCWGPYYGPAAHRGYWGPHPGHGPAAPCWW